MTEKITIQVINGNTITIDKGTSLFDLSQSHSHLTKKPILLAEVNNNLQDLSRALYFDGKVEFLDITNTNAFRVYQRSVSMLMIYAAKTILGKKAKVVIAHSLDKNFYCELPDLDKPITDELLEQMEAVMRDAVEKNIPIEKHSLPKEVGMHYAREMGFDDTVRLLKYRRTSLINFYKLDWLYSYFYGQMVPSTGYLDTFKLVKQARGFLLQLPSSQHGYAIGPIGANQKVLDVFAESKQWARIMKVDTVCALNDRMCKSGSGDIIREAEALHEKKIAYLADQIMQQKRSIVLIAGPSSSGKTTFATRLSIQLRVNGAKPYVISLDNYYLNREDVPKDEHGEYDFETIDAIDTKQIDHDLRALLGGETVEIPTFNFLTGKREYKGKTIKLNPGDVLIMEGIHGLNERISASIPRDQKFKIFISALTQVNVDDHNRIPTTDTRLLRRIVRDNQFRGYPAQRTIDMWPSVMRGESKYIFPFQEEADAFFNSALVYEMCVLKQYAEPLLFALGDDLPAYTEARRLVKFLDCFLGVPSEHVPPNSILREFVGGSCF